MRVLVSAALTLGMAFPVSAATKLVTQAVSVAAGESRPLGVFGSVSDRCTSGRSRLTVTEKPSGGTIRVVHARLKRGALARCPRLRADSAQVVYKPDPGFTGRDHVVVTIVTATGESERHEFRIQVGKPGSSTEPPIRV